MTDLPEVDLVHKAVEQLRLLQINTLANFFAFGRILHELGIKNKPGKKLYRHYASHIQTEEDFAREIGYSVSQLHNIVGALGFEKHAGNGNGGLLPIPPTRLIKLLPLNLPEEDRNEWCDKAARLSASAFENEIKAFQGKVTTDDCDHAKCAPYSKCEVCGKMMKVV